MSKIYREQHPLLCDDLSEDDHYSPQYQRLHPISYRGRAKNSMRGAAAIFTSWPDHWTSFLSYWWVALGMIAITTLLVYNSLFAFAVLPHEMIYPLKRDSTEYQFPESTHLLEVYMHVLKNYNDEVDLYQYLPYIEVVANKFNRFKYHLIVIVNDTSIIGDGLSAEMNNEIALNSLWNKEKLVKQKPVDSNFISIEYVLLSKYMDNSPIKKHWRTLSPQLIEFLIRAISIWDKGGIVFNPIILTPRSPNPVYIEKLQNILQDYKRFNKKISKDTISKKKYDKNSSKKVRQKVNNIRDIIEALNNEDLTANSTQQMLAEAEDKETLRITRSGQRLSSVTEKHAADKSASQSVYDIHIQKKLAPHLNKNYTKQLERKRLTNIDKSDDSTEKGQAHNNTLQMSFPLFLKYLFHNEPINRQLRNIQELDGKNITHIDKITASKNNETSHGNVSYSITDSKDLQHANNKDEPIIISTTKVHDKKENSSPLNMVSKHVNAIQLTLDLKGNIIATETSCHAFIGTVFSNAVHHESSTITDFIITELSMFCKGPLSSCAGIDLILL